MTTPTIENIDVEQVQEIGTTVRELVVGDWIKLTTNSWNQYAGGEVISKTNAPDGAAYWEAVVQTPDKSQIELHANWRDIPADAEDQDTPYTGAIKEPYDSSIPPITDIAVVSC